MLFCVNIFMKSHSFNADESIIITNAVYDKKWVIYSEHNYYTQHIH